MSMYNLTEYNDNYSKTSESLWQYYRAEPSLNHADVINNFFFSRLNLKKKNQVKQKLMVQKMLK